MELPKFGTERFIRGFLDLIMPWFVSKFGVKPMHFFRAVGTLMFIFRFFQHFGLGATKIGRCIIIDVYGNLIAGTQLHIALTMMIMGNITFCSRF